MLSEEQIQHNKALIEALRSGKYTQVRQTLRGVTSSGSDDTAWGFCCLGVACEVVRLATGQGEWIAAEFDGAADVPPGHVIYYYGWNTSNPRIPVPERLLERVRLKTGDPFDSWMAAAINDAGATFQEIADSFEKQLAIEIARTA